MIFFARVFCLKTKRGVCSVVEPRLCIFLGGEVVTKSSVGKRCVIVLTIPDTLKHRTGVFFFHEIDSAFMFAFFCSMSFFFRRILLLGESFFVFFFLFFGEMSDHEIIWIAFWHGGKGVGSRNGFAAFHACQCPHHESNG